MLDNYKRTLKLNKRIPEISGKKVYYDRLTLWISVIINFSINILLIIIYSFDKEIGYLILIPLTFIGTLGTIRELRTKFPVFIFQKDRFYYTLYEKWFDKENCSVRFKTKSGGLPNISGTIVIKDKSEMKIIEENIFYLDDADEFRKEMTKYTSDYNFL